MFSNLPICPGDRNDYILVTTKEGKFWRRKRGTLKKAILNDAFTDSNNLKKITAPASKRIRICLHPFMYGLEPGRWNLRIEEALRKSFIESNSLRFSYFKGLQLQDNYPLEKMFDDYTVRIKNESIYIDLVLSEALIIAQNRIATDYYFEAVFIFGDINKERSLRSDSMESPVYSFYSKKTSTCTLSFPLPAKDDWMLLLKISCLEGNEIAMHTKHYRMAVVAVNSRQT
jgi:hypothetical protein